MRNIQISIETAQRWVNGTDEELKVLALQTYPELAKKELPKRWVELGNIKGYYVTTSSYVTTESGEVSSSNTNVFSTKEQAEASIVLAQLSQLREVYRNGWVPDWNDDEIKYCIEFYNDIVQRQFYENSNHFLSFQDKETRDLFLENFRDLIEKAKPLMS